MKTKKISDEKFRERVDLAVRNADIHRILDEIGIKYEKRHSKLWMKCIAPGHRDKDPSASINIDRRSPHCGVYYCFGCKHSASIVSLIRDFYQIEFLEALAWVECRTLENAPPVDIIKEVENEIELPKYFESPESQEQWNNPYLIYLYGRGITWEQIRRHGIGYCDSGRYARRVIIPVYLYTQLRTWIGRTIWGGRRVTSCDNGKVGLFGSELANPAYGPAIISEGWADALKIEKAGYPNSMALQTNIVQEEQFNFLRNFSGIIIVPDNDTGGCHLVNSLASYVESIPIFVVHISAKDPGKADDAEIALKMQKPEKWKPMRITREIEIAL